MKHILDSAEAKEFFKTNGIRIFKKNSAHNSIELIDKFGGSLTVFTESDQCIAGGIPGIFVESKK